MSKYYIQYISKGILTFIELDATVTLSEVYGGAVTSNPIADRTVVADTFINSNPKFTLSGIITDVSQPFQRVSPLDGEPILDTSIRSRTDLMKKTLTEGTIVEFQSADELHTDCVITALNLTKTAREGVGGWKVVMELTKLNLVSALQITLNEEPIDTFSDDASFNKNVSSSTTTDLSKFKNLSGVGGAVGALFGAVPDIVVPDGGG